MRLSRKIDYCVVVEGLTDSLVLGIDRCRLNVDDNAFLSRGNLENGVGANGIAALDQDVRDFGFGHAGRGNGHFVGAGIEAEHFVVGRRRLSG